LNRNWKKSRKKRNFMTKKKIGYKKNRTKNSFKKMQYCSTGDLSCFGYYTSQGKPTLQQSDTGKICPVAFSQLIIFTITILLISWNLKSNVNKSKMNGHCRINYENYIFDRFFCSLFYLFLHLFRRSSNYTVSWIFW
jgi:hypothetical protein